MLEQNAASQAVNVAFRKHQHFDWTELGVSGITGGVLGGHLGKKVNDKLGKLDHNTGILRSEFQALAGAGAQSATTGGHFNATQVLVDNLGSAVGNAVSHVGEMLTDIGTGIKEAMDHLFAPHDNPAQSIEDLSFAGNLIEMDGLKQGFNNYLARQLDDSGGYSSHEQNSNLVNNKNDNILLSGAAFQGYVGQIYGDSERIDIGKGMLIDENVPLMLKNSVQNVWETLNSKYETKVIFSALSGYEGGQRLEAYLPMRKNGDVIDNSGITIATGFDIGQHDNYEIKNFGFPRELEEKLLPFVKATKKCAKTLLPLANQLVISVEDANLIDFAAKGAILKAAIKSWNTRKLENTPQFKDLTPAQQTILFSRTFHQGPGMPNKAVSKNFYNAALKNNWMEAENHLRNYDVPKGYYKDRVNNEANLLKRERLLK
ncbi:pesticin C-terminus-like muramidase [Legionella drancourtii]|nr:pesticin C-terminus-like muramidase [Legionella drancourtii]